MTRSAPRESPERIRSLLALFRESHYDVALARGGIATIRVGECAPAAIVRWIGRDAVGWYLTACNPWSQPLTALENERRLERLRASLAGRGARFLEGDGHVPGEAWREPSVLVAGLDRAAVDALAAEHEQNAVVVVPADAPAALRIYRADWRATLGDAPHVEWAAALA